MITTRELYKWRDEILRTQEEAEKLAENYEQEIRFDAMREGL